MDKVNRNVYGIPIGKLSREEALKQLASMIKDYNEVIDWDPKNEKRKNKIKNGNYILVQPKLN